MMTYYLVFGDLHGKLLPAFKLAMAWQREQEIPLSGLLQVGDLGYYPDHTRLDKATLRHAKNDPLELGIKLVTEPSIEADKVFHGKETPPEALWFTAGNHEDHERLLSQSQSAGRVNCFPVDYYLRTRCIKDGHVTTLPDGLRVGGLWGIDDVAPKARRKTPPTARIRGKSAVQLACSKMDVLLTHDAPLHAIYPDAGSADIADILRSTQPAFAFFGHYSGRHGQISHTYGTTKLFHMADFEIKRHGHLAEEKSVGLLSWQGDSGNFDYLERKWLDTFSRIDWINR